MSTKLNTVQSRVYDELISRGFSVKVIPPSGRIDPTGQSLQHRFFGRELVARHDSKPGYYVKASSDTDDWSTVKLDYYEDADRHLADKHLAGEVIEFSDLGELASKLSEFLNNTILCA